MIRIDEKDLGLKRVYIKLAEDYILADDKKIQNWNDAINAVADVMKDLASEYGCLICLKSDGTPINYSIMSIGSVNNAFVYPGEMIKRALLSNASQIIFLHNHPSGGANPSVADIKMTERINFACEIMNISFTDHIIIGAASKEWFSFKEKGLIDPARYKFKTSYDDIKLYHADNKQNEISSDRKQLEVAEQPVYSKKKGR